MDIISIIINEIKGLNLSILFVMLLYLVTAWFISKFAKRTFFRLFWIALGLFLIIESAKLSSHILYDIDTLLGIGFILPHFKFFFSWVYSIYNGIKMMSVNSYYFVMTIIFKFIRFFRWLYSIYKKIKSFFSKTENTNNQKEEYKEYKRDYSNSHNKEKSNRKKQEKQEENYSYNDSHNKKDYNTYEKIKSDDYKIQDEFKQFFSTSAYIVLAVSTNDDFSVVKKKYRKLIGIYHPDLNPDDIELYTKISQNINEAYEKMKKFHDTK